MSFFDNLKACLNLTRELPGCNRSWLAAALTKQGDPNKRSPATYKNMMSSLKRLEQTEIWDILAEANRSFSSRSAISQNMVSTKVVSVFYYNCYVFTSNRLFHQCSFRVGCPSSVERSTSRRARAGSLQERTSLLQLLLLPRASGKKRGSERSCTGYISLQVNALFCFYACILMCVFVLFYRERCGEDDGRPSLLERV